MATAILTRKILICDDDPDILEVLTHLLQRAGYSVDATSDHEDFFRKHKSNRPDLILLDIRMPDHDGFWVADELQRLNNRAPIIFVTAHNRSVYRLCAPVAGAVDFIVKPFEPDELVARVERALRNSARTSNWHLYAACDAQVDPEQSTE